MVDNYGYQCMCLASCNDGQNYEHTCCNFDNAYSLHAHTFSRFDKSIQIKVHLKMFCLPICIAFGPILFHLEGQCMKLLLQKQLLGFSLYQVWLLKYILVFMAK